MYSNGNEDTHAGYNHVIAVTNNYHVKQKHLQSICQQFGLKIDASENVSSNMMK